MMWTVTGRRGHGVGAPQSPCLYRQEEEKGPLKLVPSWDFCGGPAIKTLKFQCRRPGT